MSTEYRAELYAKRLKTGRRFVALCEAIEQGEGRDSTCIAAAYDQMCNARDILTNNPPICMVEAANEYISRGLLALHGSAL